jgi:hypothetical protein
LQDVVKDAVELIGCGSGADSRLPCQAPGELFFIHFQTDHKALREPSGCVSRLVW